MGEKRSVSDVILELEQRMAKLEGFMRNMDNNIKLILSRLNDDCSLRRDRRDNAGNAIASLQPQPEEEEDPMVRFNRRPKTNFFSQMKANAGIQNQQEERVGIVDVIDEDELVEDPLPRGQKRGSRVETSVGNAVTVSQIVTLQNRPVTLATVEIYLANQFTDSGERVLVKNTRTSPKGRWIAGLPPGEYMVSIIRRPTDKVKQAIHTTYELAVPPEKEFEAPLKELE